MCPEDFLVTSQKAKARKSVCQNAVDNTHYLVAEEDAFSEQISRCLENKRTPVLMEMCQKAHAGGQDSAV